MSDFRFSDLVSELIHDNRDLSPEDIEEWAKRNSGIANRMLNQGHSEDDVIDTFLEMLDEDFRS